LLLPHKDEKLQQQGYAQKKNVCLEKEIRCQNRGRGRKEGRENAGERVKKADERNG